jgi:hypothetical protein
MTQAFGQMGQWGAVALFAVSFVAVFFIAPFRPTAKEADDITRMGMFGMASALFFQIVLWATS